MWGTKELSTGASHSLGPWLPILGRISAQVQAWDCCTNCSISRHTKHTIVELHGCLPEVGRDSSQHVTT